MWDISQEWSVKSKMPPDELLARVDELKAAAGKAAEECAKLLGPFVAKLAAMHNEAVTVGRVRASSWHEAALKVAQKTAGWPLGTASIKSYFKSRLDPESGRLRPRPGETAATDVDTELHHLMATVEHDGEEMEARLRIETAKLGEALVDDADRLSGAEARILEVLRTNGPMKGRAIALAVDRSFSGQFRGELAGMTRRRRIKHSTRGYELPQ